MTHLSQLDEFELARLRHIAAAKREQAKAFAHANLKLDFADTNHWRTLAARYGVKLPVWYRKGSELKYLKRALRILGYGTADVADATGFTTLREFAASNPTWPAFALVGLILEHRDSTIRIAHIDEDEL